MTDDAVTAHIPYGSILLFHKSFLTEYGSCDNTQAADAEQDDPEMHQKTRFLGVSVQKADVTDGNSCITVYISTVKLITLQGRNLLGVSICQTNVTDIDSAIAVDIPFKWIFSRPEGRKYHQQQRYTRG